MFLCVILVISLTVKLKLIFRCGFSRNWFQMSLTKICRGVCIICDWYQSKCESGDDSEWPTLCIVWIVDPVKRASLKLYMSVILTLFHPWIFEAWWTFLKMKKIVPSTKLLPQYSVEILSGTKTPFFFSEGLYVQAFCLPKSNLLLSVLGHLIYTPYSLV